LKKGFIWTSPGREGGLREGELLVFSFSTGGGGGGEGKEGNFCREGGGGWLQGKKKNPHISCKEKVERTATTLTGWGEKEIGGTTKHSFGKKSALATKRKDQEGKRKKEIVSCLSCGERKERRPFHFLYKRQIKGRRGLGLLLSKKGKKKRTICLR